MSVQRTFRASIALAGIYVLLFGMLGLSAYRAREVYQGFGASLPVTTQVAVRYGVVAFPCFGLVTAFGLVLAGRSSRHRWLPFCLGLVAIAVFWCSLQTLIVSSF